jgi:CBS domain containing-hemolysin-like protein
MDLLVGMLYGALTLMIEHPLQGVSAWLATTFIIVVMLPSIAALFPYKGFKKVPAAAFALWWKVCVVLVATVAARIAIAIAKLFWSVLCWMFRYSWERAMPGARRSKRKSKRKAHANRHDDHEDNDDHDDTEGDGEDHDEH